MRVTCSSRHRLSPGLPRASAAHAGALVFLLACALALLPIELGGQGNKPAAPPKQPKITSLVTDRTELALSPNFGAAGGYSINQSGDLAFLVGGSALFVRRAGAASPTRLLQMGDPAPGFPDTRCELISSGVINNAGHVAFSVEFNRIFGHTRTAIYVWDGAVDGLRMARPASPSAPAPAGCVP